MFDHDKLKSIPLTEEEWKRMRTPWQKFCGWLGGVFKPLI